MSQALTSSWLHLCSSSSLRTDEGINGRAFLSPEPMLSWRACTQNLFVRVNWRARAPTNPKLSQSSSDETVCAVRAFIWALERRLGGGGLPPGGGGGGRWHHTFKIPQARSWRLLYRKKKPEASPVYQLRPSRQRSSGGGGTVRAGAGPSSVLRCSKNIISPTGSARGEDGPGLEEHTHTYAFRLWERDHRGAAETHSGPTRLRHGTTRWVSRPWCSAAASSAGGGSVEPNLTILSFYAKMCRYFRASLQAASQFRGSAPNKGKHRQILRGVGWGLVMLPFLSGGRGGHARELGADPEAQQKLWGHLVHERRRPGGNEQTKRFSLEWIQTTKIIFFFVCIFFVTNNVKLVLEKLAYIFQLKLNKSYS